MSLPGWCTDKNATSPHTPMTQPRPQTYLRFSRTLPSMPESSFLLSNKKVRTMTNLTPKQRHIITDILNKRLPDQEVRLFGSRATGKAKPWSDIDLVICNKTPVQDLA